MCSVRAVFQCCCLCLRYSLLKFIAKPVSSSSSTGLSDIPGEAMVKLYCPKCMDVYTPKSSRHHHTDGAYFGTGFPHMLFMVHPEYRPKRPANQFVPRSVRRVCPCRLKGLSNPNPQFVFHFKHFFTALKAMPLLDDQVLI